MNVVKDWQLDPFDSSAIMKKKLPESLEEVLVPYEPVYDPDTIDTAITDFLLSPNPRIVIWQKLMNLAKSKISSVQEIIYSLQIWFDACPVFRDMTDVRCHHFLFFLPKHVQLSVLQWREYRSDDYGALWLRMIEEIPLLVKDAEIANILPENRFNYINED